MNLETDEKNEVARILRRFHRDSCYPEAEAFEVAAAVIEISGVYATLLNRVTAEIVRTIENAHKPDMQTTGD